jgi:hypothetical protein
MERLSTGIGFEQTPKSECRFEGLLEIEITGRGFDPARLEGLNLGLWEITDFSTRTLLLSAFSLIVFQ